MNAPTPQIPHTARPTRRQHLRHLLQAATGGGLLATFPAWGQAPAPAPASTPSTVGVVDFVAGSVSLRRGTSVQTARVGTALQAGDTLETGPGGELHARFEDGGFLAVRQSSTVRIDQYVTQGEPTDVAVMSLLRGALRSVSGWIGKVGAPSQYRINAGTSTVGIRGTDHELLLVLEADATLDLPAGVHNRVFEGGTTISNADGQLDIAQGAAGFAGRVGERPRLHAGVPGFFARLGPLHDQRVQAHRQGLRSFMERQLRARGKLTQQQNFNQFLQRHRPARTGAATLREGQLVNDQTRPLRREIRQSDSQETRRQQTQERHQTREQKQQGQQ